MEFKLGITKDETKKLGQLDEGQRIRALLETLKGSAIKLINGKAVAVLTVVVAVEGRDNDGREVMSSEYSLAGDLPSLLISLKSTLPNVEQSIIDTLNEQLLPSDDD